MINLDDIEDLLGELAKMQDRLQQTPDPVREANDTVDIDAPSTFLQQTLYSYFAANPGSRLTKVRSIKNLRSFDTSMIGDSLTTIERARDLFSSANDFGGLGKTSMLRAHAMTSLGDVPASISSLSEALGYFTVVDDTTNAIRCAVNLGVCKAALPSYYTLMSETAEAVASIPSFEAKKTTAVERTFSRLEEREEELRGYATALVFPL